jgi:enoyl-CoA hydratase/carnithine racemase
MSNAPETILVKTADAVATITLFRPARLNAFTNQMGAELFATLAALDRDPDVRAIVVTGSGRAFCAGADLDPSGSTFAGDGFQDSRVAEERVRPWTMNTPIIAAINGPAVGVGATLPLHWDIRLASDQARFAFPFTRRGITPEAGSTWILPRLVGLAAAMDLLITGRTISAAEALALGLVSRVVPHAELLMTAQHVAREIAEHTAPVAVALTRRLLWLQLMDDDPTSARRREDAAFTWTGHSDDATEGVRAFLEKRAPRFPMRAPADVPDPLLGAPY